jgi:hypothetical protein
MSINHECQYAAYIGRKPEWQTDDFGKTVCVYCHVEEKKVPAPVDAKPAITKTVRK